MKRLLLLIVLILVFIGCSQKVDEYKIGVVNSVTGAFASYGKPIQNGLLLAEKEINNKGGIDGIPIKLILEDDESDNKKAVNAFTKLATIDKVPVVIGPLSSGASLATAPVAEKEKTVQISTLAGTLDLSSAGDYIFRIYPASDIASKFIANKAVHKFNARKVAVFYANDAFGRTASKFVKQVLEENKIEIVTEESFESGGINFKPQLTRIKKINPDLVICSAYYEDGARILVQARELGLDLPFLGEDGWFGPIADNVGDAIKNLYFANVAFGEEFKDNEVMQKFIINYKAKYNEPPTAGAAAGYDAVYIVKELIEKNGYEAAKIKDALYTIDYTGAFGGIKYDENGDNIGAKYALYQLNSNNESILVKKMEH